MNFLKPFAVIMGIFFLGVPLYAQEEDCEITLSRALEEFQAGHFLAIPSIVSPCLNKFTSEQKQRANILLTQTYLLLDDPIGARRSYLEVLRANPEFLSDPNIHSIDVVYLSRKFTATPTLGWFGKAGPNVSPIRVIYDNDLFEAHEKYSLKTGYHLGFGGDIYILDNFGIRGELIYLFSTYNHRLSEYHQKDRSAYTERQSWLDLPVSFMYHDNKGKYRPYGYAGYSFGYLFRDIANVTIEAINTAESAKDEKESPDLNMITKRNRVNQSLIIGGGVKYKFGLQFLFVDVRYAFGMKNIVNQTNLYADNSLDPTTPEYVNSASALFGYGHIDDYFRIDNLSFSVGFLQPFYKPRELKKARTRSVMKKIQSQGK